MKKRLSLQQKAELAMKEAIVGVIEDHKKPGLPLSVWSEGKVVHISPHHLPSLKRMREGK